MKDKIIKILKEELYRNINDPLPYDVIATRIMELETPKAVTDGEIKQAASDHEKIACCEKDHPFLKEYVNEDFEAGAKWMRATHQEGGECYAKVFCDKEQPIENTIADTDKGRLIYHIEVDQWRTLESGWVEKVPTFWYKLITQLMKGSEG